MIPTRLALAAVTFAPLLSGCAARHPTGGRRRPDRTGGTCSTEVVAGQDAEIAQMRRLLEDLP